MADHSFENRLHRLFSEAPVLPDAPVFAARVESRLDRGWAARRLLIGGAGVVGGAVAVAQLIGADISDRLGAASRQSVAAARNSLAHLPLPGGAELASLHNLPFGGEALWLVAGLGVLAAALLATRSVEEI